MLKNEEGIIQIAVNENQQHQQQIYFQGEVIRQLQHQQQQQELQLQQQQQQIQQQQQLLQKQQQQQQLLNQQIQNPNMNGPLLSNRNDNHVFVIPFIKYEEIEPNHDTQQYFKNLLKKICQEYKGINFGTWIGAVNPNGRGWMVLSIYNTNDVNDEGLPRFCGGSYQNCSNNLVAGKITRNIPNFTIPNFMILI